jgi:hypothetical protein
MMRRDSQGERELRVGVPLEVLCGSPEPRRKWVF